ncbi:MAG: hypothetical protein A4E52_00073 [Pelotomaculum sp. PtaB.Bin013]|uniref:CARDB domain-containing protein n=1 Tax=Pelotomaculum isophthalicicum JI TaxID=947010 RepID=A0A9X4H3A5_9FIRM|nr:hypothetical protein [Pelotomaculum isophthalicicum]MDF9409495.1 hypothetical protein [Pelotomaculum isophthalicicum JI]OPX92207.1 MAG: hypothetical protein A4E52_00073 [Pelotomaculum sp. PtaB.Bin013]
MLRKLIAAFVLLTLLAGFSFSEAQAGEDKLQKVLQINGLPAERWGLQARLDRGQIVYGLPTDIDSNDWKPAPPDADGNDWQKANGMDLGHPGEEPRYLGKTIDGSDFTNELFPMDAPDQIAPAQRDMIFQPWYENYCALQNSNSYSDQTWSIIAKTLQTYNKRIGYPGAEDSFTNNPALKSGDFNVTIRDYFKVLTEPEPGLTGTVRHWHNRSDLGGVYYETITVKWDVIPDFIVESIDPGVPKGEKVQKGKKYTGKVVLKTKPDSSFLSSPKTKELFDVLEGGKVKLSQDYAVPFGVAINGQLVQLKNLQPVPDLTNVYWYSVKGNKAEDTLEVTFDWTSDGGPVKIGAAVNTLLENTLPQEAWNDMDWSELTNTNNTKFAELQGEVKNLKVTDITLSPEPGQPGQLTSGVITVKNDSEMGFANVETLWRARRLDGTVLAENTIVTNLAAGEQKTLPFSFTPDLAGEYSVAAMINPDHSNPPDEVNFLSGDWPGDNRMEVPYTVKGKDYDIKVQIIPGMNPWSTTDNPAYMWATVIVSRKDELPETLPVRLTISGDGGTVVKTFDLPPKGSPYEYEYNITASVPGYYNVEAQAWPFDDSWTDVYPPDNVDSVTIEYIHNKPPEIQDDKLHGEIIDSEKHW